MDTRSKAAWLSVFSNIILVTSKLIIGITIGSVSVISEAIHSANDLLASCIALFAIKTSTRPPDKEHPYGHGKIENISGTIEALLIFIAAAMIIKEAFEKI
jgi:cation diffusion facilitator family transporter